VHLEKEAAKATCILRPFRPVLAACLDYLDQRVHLAKKETKATLVRLVFLDFKD
jgi:hypothetical protein